MLSKLDNKTMKLVSMAESIAFDLGACAVGTEHVILAVLKMKDCKLCKILERNSVNYKVFNDKIIEVFGKKDVKPYYMEYTLKTFALLKFFYYQKFYFLKD